MRIQSPPFQLQESENTVDQGNGGLKIVGLSFGAAVLVVLSAALVCLLYRRRRSLYEHHTTLLLKKSPLNERPLSLRKSTAVKSPGSQCPGPTLKKSPSPTEHKSPPGESGKDHEDPSLGERKSLIEGGPTKETSGNLKKVSASMVEGDESSGNNGKISVVKSNELEKISTSDFSEKEITSFDKNKLGKLHLKLKYNYEKQALCVTIVKCSDLTARDNCENLDPYVKLQLIPNKQHKVKTRVMRRTTNPVYDEEFIFYEVTPDMLATTSLHFVVLSFDRYSRDDVIGEVYYQLAHLHFDTLEKQISLVQDISPRSLKIRSQGRGEILVSLCYQPAANRLTVVILKARNLPKIDVSGLCDPFVKIYLLYNDQRIAKKKTHVKKHTSDPVFNESFVFDLPSGESLDKISLEFLVLDYDRVTKNEVIGKLDIGVRASPTAQKHWHDVAASPRRQIAEWHKLRE